MKQAVVCVAVLCLLADARCGDDHDGGADCVDGHGFFDDTDNTDDTIHEGCS